MYVHRQACFPPVDHCGRCPLNPAATEQATAAPRGLPLARSPGGAGAGRGGGQAPAGQLVLDTTSEQPRNEQQTHTKAVENLAQNPPLGLFEFTAVNFGSRHSAHLSCSDVPAMALPVPLKATGNAIPDV